MDHIRRQKNWILQRDRSQKGLEGMTTAQINETAARLDHAANPDQAEQEEAQYEGPKPR